MPDKTVEQTMDESIEITQDSAITDVEIEELRLLVGIILQVHSPN